MKFQKLLTFLFALLLVTSMTSCDKDKDKEPSNRDLLTAEKWTGHSFWAFGNDISDLFLEQLNYDIKKNTVKFDKAGTYVDSYERTSISGTWEFANDDKSIIFDKGTEDEYTATVLLLTDKELRMDQTVETEEGPLTLEVRFTR
ncbi:hypothetical protein K3G39_18860 [Pontibacter sp. HSC-14F20]|uniref:hypothetical protein n=1 Tax=Pontibacter sp. HSC-14F20 TaxID=2864136 RepID=UPI001C73B2BC|nr:hypothetical protein [Pontibacter sp. HSC-14F20]MBX0335301.1 hypothetical protein [Pontibacter sp. HSC-14F20]